MEITCNKSTKKLKSKRFSAIENINGNNEGEPENNENLNEEELHVGGGNRVNRIFDNTLTELTINVPHKYKRDPVKLLQEEKNKLINLLINEIRKDESITSFGFIIKLIVKLYHQEQGSDHIDYDILYLHSDRHIINFNDLDNIFTIISNSFCEQLNDIVFKMDASGWKIDEITEMKFIYHKAFINERVGYFSIPYPCFRGRRLVFNPRGVNERDSLCLLRCIAAHKLKKTIYTEKICKYWKKNIGDP